MNKQSNNSCKQEEKCYPSSQDQKDQNDKQIQNKQNFTKKIKYTKNMSKPQNCLQYLKQLYSSDQVSKQWSLQTQKAHKSQTESQQKKQYSRSQQLSNKSQQQTNFEQIVSYLRNQSDIQRQKSEQIIIKDGRFFKCNTFTDQILILSSEHSKYYEVVKLQVQLSNFKTNIQILNTVSSSHIHSNAQLGGFGAFGNVYFIKFEHQQYAVKCILFDTDCQDQQMLLRQKSLILANALKQYFFLLLFSVLKIGPMVKNILGFDIVVSRQCIEFSTEICSQRNFSLKQEQDIKNSLRLMHSLKVVHRDIKPDNIMYSKSFKKHVFIDFGGSVLLKESIGQKSLTKFLGTTGFCSQEMMALLGNNKSQIDLYYNDLFSLKKSLERFPQHNKSKTIYQISDHYRKYLDKAQNNSSFLLLNLIKYHIYNKNQNEFLFHWRCIQKRHADQVEQVQIQLLCFLMDIEPYDAIVKFYWNCINSQIRNMNEFIQLKTNFSNQLYIDSSRWKKYPLKQEKLQHQINFYKLFICAYGTLSPEEKLIGYVLLNKQSIQRFIFEDKIQTLNYNQCNGNFLQIFFLIVVNYCTFTQNKYEASLPLKIKASQKAIQLIERLDSNKHRIVDLMFELKIKQTEPLAKLFQYFIFYILVDIPEQFKQKSMINSFSSLILLGYPIFVNQARYFMLRSLMDDKRTSKIERIIRFVKFHLVLLNYSQVIYDRHQSNFNYQISNEQFISYSKKLRQYFTPQNPNPNSFQHLNYRFYMKTFVSNRHITEFEVKQLLQQLNKDHNFEDIDSESYQKWKKIMYFVIIFISTAYEMTINFEQFDKLSQSKIMIYDEDISSLPYLFCNQYLKYELIGSYKPLNHVLRIIDQVINYQSISLRYFLGCRIIVSYYGKDYAKLQKVLKILLETTQTYSLMNMVNLQRNFTIIQALIKRQVNQTIAKLNCEVYQKQHFQLIIKHAHKIASICCQQDLNQYSRSFLSYLESGQIDLGDCLIVISYLFNLLGNLYSVNQLHLRMYQKIKSLHKISQSNNKLTQMYSKDQEQCLKNLQQIKKCFKSQFLNLNLKKYIKSNRDSINHYVSFYMSIHLKNRQFQKASKVFEDAFGQNYICDNNFYCEQSKQTVPVMKAYIIYCMVKAHNSPKNSFQWENKLIYIYQKFRNDTVSLSPMLNHTFYKVLFQSFIYCQKKYQQIEDLLVFITKSLKASPNRFHIQLFNQIFQSRIYCTCIQCYKKPLNKWNAVAFIDFLESKCSTYDERQDAYMSLIFRYCIQSRNTPPKTKKKLINFVRKSLPYLSLSAKSFVTHHLYQHSLNIFNAINGIDLFLKEYEKWKSENSSLPVQILNLHFSEGMKKRFSEKVLKKHIFHYIQVVKHGRNVHSLAETIEKHFGMKQKLLKSYIFPQKIKQCFRKKLAFYHFVQQNYIWGNPPSQIQILVHKMVKDKYQIQ